LRKPDIITLRRQPIDASISAVYPRRQWLIAMLYTAVKGVFGISGPTGLLHDEMNIERIPYMRKRAPFDQTAMARHGFAARTLLLWVLVMVLWNAIDLIAAESKDDTLGVHIVVNLSLPPVASGVQKAYSEEFCRRCKSFFEGLFGTSNVEVTVGGSRPADSKKRFLFTIYQTLTVKLSTARPYHLEGTVTKGGLEMGPGREEGYTATGTLRRSESCKFTDLRGGKTISWQAADEISFEGRDVGIYLDTGLRGGGSPEGARQSALNHALDAMANGNLGTGFWYYHFVKARVVRVYRDEVAWRKFQANTLQKSYGKAVKPEPSFLFAEIEIVNNLPAALNTPSAEFQWSGSTPAITNNGTEYKWYEYACEAEVPYMLMPGSLARVICPVDKSGVGDWSFTRRDPARGQDLVPRLMDVCLGRCFPERDQAWLDQHLAGLKDADVAVRRTAAKAFRETLVPEAVEALQAALQDADNEVRTNAFESLVPLGLPEVAPYAVQELGDPRSTPRRAKEALSIIGLPAFDAIAKGLTDDNPVVRQECARLLADWPSRKAVDPLIGALRDANASVRAAAADALGGLGDLHAVKPLEKALTDPDAYVARAARSALNNLTRK